MTRDQRAVARAIYQRARQSINAYRLIIVREISPRWAEIVEATAGTSHRVSPTLPLELERGITRLLDASARLAETDPLRAAAELSHANQVMFQNHVNLRRLLDAPVTFGEHVLSAMGHAGFAASQMRATGAQTASELSRLIAGMATTAAKGVGGLLAAFIGLAILFRR